jgi:hypothetical protein
MPKKGLIARSGMRRRTQQQTELRGSPMKFDDPAIQSMIHQLVDTLQEELRQNQRLLRLVRRKKDTLLRNAHHELDTLARAEKEVLGDIVTVERDRIQLLTEVGQVLGHPQPSRLRIAEIVLHASPESRDELLDIRDDLRDVADELDDLNSVEPLFTRHRQDNVRLYVSPSRWSRSLNCDQNRPQSRTSGAHAVSGQEDS